MVEPDQPNISSEYAIVDSIPNILFIVLLCMSCGIICGALNGFILKVFPMPPLIATLCTGYKALRLHS